MNTEETKPLYKVLNEKRSKGVWSLATYQTKTSLHIKTDTFRRNNSQKYICEVKQVLADGGIDNEDENNLKYIALAVNNFASVVDALNHIVNDLQKHYKPQKLLSSTHDKINNAKQALNNIKL
jgi:hypothetical protein